MTMVGVTVSTSPEASVGPKPVPNNTTISPGSAGVAPLMVAAGPIKVPLTCSAAAYRFPLVAFVPMVKKPGDSGSTFTVTGALARPLLVIWICAVPVDTVAGTRKFTCVLLTKLTGTAVLLIVTPTPLTEVGRVLPVTCQEPVVSDNPCPVM